MTYYPTKGRLIVKQERETQTKSGIFLPEQAQTKGNVAEVTAISEDVTVVKLGDKVYFDKSAGSIVFDDGHVVFTVLEEDEILAIVKENE